MMNPKTIVSTICIALVSIYPTYSQAGIEDDNRLQKAIPKELLETKSVSMSVSQAKGKLVTIYLRNNTDSKISFTGYGIQSPWYRIQKKVKGKWIEHKVGWFCGTGLYRPILNSQKYCEFTVHLPQGEVPYRVGLQVTMLNPETNKSLLVWTDEIGGKKDLSPFVGSWEVVKGMTAEDAQAGKMIITFKQNGLYETSYVSPGWSSLSTGLWKSVKKDLIKVTGVENTVYSPQYKPSGKHTQKGRDFECTWQITGKELTLKQSRGEGLPLREFRLKKCKSGAREAMQEQKNIALP